jgi:hypothetical protein
MAVEWSNLIKAVLMVLAIAVVIGGAYLFYVNFLVPQSKSDFSAQSSAVQASINSQTSSFVSSLENCMKKTTNECLCKNALVNLPKEVSAQINNKGTIPSPDITINFLFNGKNFRSNDIANVSVSAITYKSGEKSKVEFGPEKTYFTTLSFEDGIKFNDLKVISNDIYKQGLGLSFIVYNSQVLGFIGKNEEEQKAMFDKLPVC